MTLTLEIEIDEELYYLAFLEGGEWQINGMLHEDVLRAFTIQFYRESLEQIRWTFPRGKAIASKNVGEE